MVVTVDFNIVFKLSPSTISISQIKKDVDYKSLNNTNIIDLKDLKFSKTYIKENFEIIQIADGGVFSCFEHISKPNIEIYQNLINKYQINVKESIFIDDTNKNIISANKLGFQTILFNDIGQLKLLKL